MFNAFRNRPKMVIYIDHSVTVFIIKQTKLTTSNTDKLNFRFVRASIFFNRIRCETQAGKTTCNTRRFVSSIQKNIIGDTFGHRNIFDFYHTFPIVEDELLPIYHIIFVKMADEFKTRLKQIYQNNKQWKRFHNLVNLHSKTTALSIPKRFHLLYQ